MSLQIYLLKLSCTVTVDYCLGQKMNYFIERHAMFYGEPPGDTIVYSSENSFFFVIVAIVEIYDGIL